MSQLNSLTTNVEQCKILYRFYTFAQKIPIVRKICPYLEQLLGLKDYEFREEWKELGFYCLTIPETQYNLILDPRNWAQRVSIFKGEYYEVAENLFLQKNLKSGDIFIDIGANIGFHLIHASYLVEESGYCYGFEPNQTAFKLLEAHLTINRIKNTELHNIALFNQETTLSMKWSTKESGGGTIRPDVEDNNEQLVQAKMGDTFFHQIPSGVSGICKIDTEGADFKVLLGMENFVSNHPNFMYLVEVTPKWLELLGNNVQEMLSFFERYQFKPLRLTFNGEVLEILDIAKIAEVQQQNLVFRHIKN